MHALICDDDDFILRTLEHALKRVGYQVTRVQNAADAMNVLRNTPIRLVITDWEMPGMSGVDLCKAVREEDLNGYVYLIMLTARDTVDQRVQALSAGADDFISKPFSRDELMACLKTAERILSLETRDLAMFALAKLAESRDPETGAHIERVQSYSKALAIQLAKTPKYAPIIDNEYVRLIYQTSPLHDIGKVGIPDNILLKPGKLDPSEYEAMKAHVLIGARTLEAALQRFPNARFLQMARDIAASHHEKYNGKGYPASLMGDQIPLSGRIVALADVYDALSSRRVYKAAMGHEETRRQILRERGEHFDPDIVDAFIAIEDKFIEIHTRLCDDASGESLLPVAAAPAMPAPAPVATRPQVMVVEDDRILLSSVAKVLAESGYSVVEAADAESAIQLATTRRPMVIISDWSMPGLSGVDLCKQLRQAHAGEAIHFIMLTMHTDKSRLLEAFDAGVDDFLSKPFDVRELLVRVRTGLRSVGAQEELKLRTDASLRLNAQLSQLNTQLEKLAVTDELTRLFNRRQAMQRMEEQWNLADRYNTPMTVMMADIDHFKSINDVHGHDAGDSVLKAVASILKEQARSTDVVCRVGGEEFLILFPTEQPEEAAVYANRCRAAIEARAFVAFGTTMQVTISIGLATRTPEMTSSSDLLRAADIALYTAKSGGRNRVHATGVPTLHVRAA